MNGRLMLYFIPFKYLEELGVMGTLLILYCIPSAFLLNNNLSFLQKETATTLERIWEED